MAVLLRTTPRHQLAPPFAGTESSQTAEVVKQGEHLAAVSAQAAGCGWSQALSRIICCVFLHVAPANPFSNLILDTGKVAEVPVWLCRV